MRILLAVDASENAQRAARYVGSLLRHTPDITVTLFHVLKPMPRVLLEHGGSENPATEQRLSAQLHQEQEAWLKKEREAECPILTEACETLVQSGFDVNRVAMKFGHEDDIAGSLLEETRRGRHDTVVVGRTGTSRMRRVFGGGVTDRLLHDAKGLTIWIVE